MHLNMACRGRSILHHLRLSDKLSAPARVVPVSSHVRRISRVTNVRFPSLTNGKYISRATLPTTLINSYATAASRPKAHTGRAKATKEGDKKKNDAKKATALKPKPKPKKELTPKQVEAREAKKLREEIKELKAKALQPPKRLPTNVFMVAVSEKWKEVVKPGLSGPDGIREIAKYVKNLPAEERERYARIAESNIAASNEAYGNWIKSHTPLQIKEANNARQRLAKLQGKKKPVMLRDDRLVKQPLPAYLIYFKERNEQGDFRHMEVKDIAARVSEEWRGMTESEKEKYRQLQADDIERYRREYRSAYGEECYVVRRAANAKA